jgi:hypothetical protein
MVVFKEKKSLGQDVPVACYRLIAESKLLCQHGFRELAVFEDMFRLFIKLIMQRSLSTHCGTHTHSSSPWIACHRRSAKHRSH